eukprot:scaffold521_cov167-Amphora_coffeaeformis.AAC.1
MTENKALAEVTKAPSHLEWVRIEELGYIDVGAAQVPESDHQCFYCASKPPKDTKLAKCSKCKVAGYCQRECQVKDWKKSHKSACATYKRVGPDMRGLYRSADAAAAARMDIYNRIRFYACAFAAFKEATLGRGFLFIQADQSLAALSLAVPKDCYGRTLPTRGVIVHYLTVGEYDSEVCRDDFELATVRTDLQKVVDDYDEQSEVVLLFRFRCGHVAVGKAKLAMPYGSFRKLGTDLFAENNAPCVQLNIDDV